MQDADDMEQASEDRKRLAEAAEQHEAKLNAGSNAVVAFNGGGAGEDREISIEMKEDPVSSTRRRPPPPPLPKKVGNSALLSHPSRPKSVVTRKAAVVRSVNWRPPLREFRLKEFRRWLADREGYDGALARKRAHAHKKKHEKKLELEAKSGIKKAVVKPDRSTRAGRAALAEAAKSSKAASEAEAAGECTSSPPLPAMKVHEWDRKFCRVHFPTRVSFLYRLVFALVPVTGTVLGVAATLFYGKSSLVSGRKMCAALSVVARV